jgi:hypothetical protein
MTSIDKRHGGPYDRGSADRYYGRRQNPHYYKGATGSSELVTQSYMTDQEVQEYMLGWEEETDRKNWY